MTGLWIYAYLILPFIVVGMGYAALRWHLHQASKEN